MRLPPAFRDLRPGGPNERSGSSVKEDAFTSSRATLLVFEFQGELLAFSSWSAEQYIEEQMFFTIGQLNGKSSVGRLDKLEYVARTKPLPAKHRSRTPTATFGVGSGSVGC